MMESCKKSLEMFLDRPGITPNTLDLDVSPTCLREKERSLLGVCGQFGGEEERDISI
jgi:hypothetical protein